MQSKQSHILKFYMPCIVEVLGMFMLIKFLLYSVFK